MSTKKDHIDMSTKSPEGTAYHNTGIYPCDCGGDCGGAVLKGRYDCRNVMCKNVCAIPKGWHIATCGYLSGITKDTIPSGLCNAYRIYFL